MASSIKRTRPLRPEPRSAVRSALISTPLPCGHRWLSSQSVFQRSGYGSREENASKPGIEPPFRFNRNGKASDGTSVTQPRFGPGGVAGGLIQVIGTARGRIVPGLLALGPQNRPDFLASCGNPAIYRAISHGNMAQKAVRWQPGHKARLLTRFRRNQPENFHYGASRFLYASAA